MTSVAIAEASKGVEHGVHNLVSRARNHLPRFVHQTYGGVI